MITPMDKFEALENEHIQYFTTYLAFRLFVNAYMEQPEPVFIEHVRKLVDSWKAMMLQAVDNRVKTNPGARAWAFGQRHAINCAAESCYSMLLQLRGVKEPEEPNATAHVAEK